MNARPRPQRTLPPAPLILAATLTVACGLDSPASRGNLTTTIDTIDGIIRVTNTGDAPEWQLTEVVSIGPKSLTETGSPDEFGGVRSVALGPGDALYIADLVNREVRVFGLDGAHRRTFGREGEGPGEFASLHSITWVGDRLLALDYVTGRITEFSAEGDALGQRRMRGRIGGSPLQFRFFPVSPDEVYAMTYVVDETRRGLMFAGHDGKLWVEVLRTAGNRWELFDTEGRLLGTFPVRPRKEDAAPAFGPDHLVTIRRDSLDLDHVDVWRIDRGRQ